ncbi:hypothetical protein IL306_001646 [Fusarium sp. DS 682]|nr:hypothetical protein IL306_001646 [Fusarium sp. DS 682]
MESENQFKSANKEKTNVTSVRQLRDKHLVRAIFAGTRGKEALFFFPWAQGGDLYHLFLEKSLNTGAFDIKWMLDQMVGLSRALSLLADNGYRHSDLKPANILLFPDKYGNQCLKITDVGVSKVHILATSRRLDGTTAKHTTRRYSPPEFDLLFNDREPLEESKNIELSRKFDIWSLGCVFVEFLIWAKLGQQKYKDFDQFMGSDGRFWDSRSKDLDVRVKEEIKNLEAEIQDTPDDNAVQQVLALAQTKMLLAGWDQRDKASKIHKKLEIIKKEHGEYHSQQEKLNLPLGLTGEQALEPDALQPGPSLPSGNDPADPADPDAPESSQIRGGGLNTTAIPPSNTAAMILGLGKDEELNCVRDGPTFNLNDRQGPPIMSLFSDPGYDTGDLESTQIGYPTVSLPDSPERYHLFQQWLHVCDNEHGHAPMASSDGDGFQMPNSEFPKAMLKYYKGGRITLFQNLYEKYSRLNFSHISDRPVAILGLEKRLSTVLQTRGEFGILEQYLARSLLWSRPDNTFLKPITFGGGHHVPSWSWMAYEGPITYANVPFDEVDWSTECVLPSKCETDTSTMRSILSAVARKLDLEELDLLNRVKRDEQSDLKLSDLRGVILGKDKKRESRSQVHYVLLVAPSKGEPDEKKVYVRKGVAWLFEHNIALGGEDIVIY